MTAEVLAPMSALGLGQTVLPPSPVSQKSPRHGRARGASFAKNKGGHGGHRRGYSLNEDRDSVVTKALYFVLRRSIKEGQEEESDDERVTANADGWVDLDDVLDHPHVKALGITLEQAQSAVSSGGKTRLALRQAPNSDAEDPASYQIRRVSAQAATEQDSKEAVTSDSEVLTLDSKDLPEFVVYETSYAKYPLILSSGGIKRAGGQDKLSFAVVRLAENGADVSSESEAEVSIFVNLRAAMAAQPAIAWQRSSNGSILTAGNTDAVLPMSLWTKAVARRQDIGVLFEDGKVRKEVPVGLRGKGAKAKKGKGALKSSMKKSLKGRAEEESSASD